MDGPSRRALLLGSLGTLAVFAALFAVVDLGRVVGVLRSADPWLVALAVGFVCCWLVSWSLMLHVVLSGLGVDLPALTTVFVYAGAVFSNNITPFGQAGGEPVAALLISKVSGSRYETGLVGIATVDVLNVVPSVSLIVVGVGVFAATASVDGRLEAAVASAVVLVGSVLAVLWAVWRSRAVVIDRLPAVVAHTVDRIDRGRFDAAAIERGLGGRLERFFDNIELVSTDRWRLLGVVGLSLCGWLFQSVALLLTFAALGTSVPPAVVLFTIPLANLAGAAPLPGGLGGIEAAFVGLLVPTTGVDAATVTAAVLLFRGAVYGIPVVIGGVSVSVFGARAVD